MYELSPQPLWDIFAQICAIPHPSDHEEALACYIVKWAEKKSLVLNAIKLVIFLFVSLQHPAWKISALLSFKPIWIWCHKKTVMLSMILLKILSVPIIDNGWVKARGTTLGVDNGIGMDSALTILADENVKHGPIEVLLTMTKETGMVGAFGLQPNWLQADILINTDSEEEGQIYMGCAGGVDFTTTFALTKEAIPTNHKVFKITLKDLTGGHSGGDIHLGLANANKLLARFLAAYVSGLQLKLIHIEGSTLRNAIPRESHAIIAVPISVATNF